ncbi:MAG TPA: biotin carboxylase N-terminal domain-containing protein [Syntrophales bacterium]|nr:biotin carboxylase N-terminal domain-containing protein [Syntrophales bacterium]HQQ28018.1 biotin carboxylase N-terminal domain-containing protein [Syntrophales bacterium]
MATIRKILIANRGEIVLRIIRTVKEMGREAVAVYETPDQNALYLRHVKEAVLLGDGPRKDYLNIEKMIRAACVTGADAIHPGYGFLAENADFAAACERENIIFIGPPPKVIADMGNKVMARQAVARTGIPTIPGTTKLSPGDTGIEEAIQFAGEQGYPVMLKALAGGGGRGIRKVSDEDELRAAVPVARLEALSAFNDETLYAEKCISPAKHVEVQILADRHGGVIHLGTRDCSIQRRNQKLLEVAPADLPQNVLGKIHDAAIRAAMAVGYENAGTVEFLIDPGTNEFWFLEVNTRLQVEHTVTEMLTGVDIVRQQILIAEGKPLELHQENRRLQGRAIEVRVNAEDPKNRFMPEGGKTIEQYRQPGGPGVRLDELIYQGYHIPKEYDSLLAKITVRGYEWKQTVERLKRALQDFVITGPRTTIPLYLSICNEPDFIEGRFDTSYIGTHPRIFDFTEPEPGYVSIDPVPAVVADLREEKVPLLKEKEPEKSVAVSLEREKLKSSLTLPEIESLARIGDIRSPISGTINQIYVEVGDVVEDGDILLLMEAMKMHTQLVSEINGTVAEIYAQESRSVDFGEPLLKIRVDET